ncbi:MAG: GDP-mannose-dependent alpha-(1-2)-phosphatidylinositol mannosyltransferase [Parcubacteria group bacterium ADurb.Bin159]|jgi:glycosyltransferase involved in cell wall biosynthesis|nr:MAG: GDP-mannose-dependent alpha-(1-2)-phosphatidylinositol mannosyltransferase [Parcubacteria group bacterium ADurb.Bin159]
MLKIAHIVCAFPPYQGGMGNVCFNQATYLAKIGHQVTVFAPQINNQESFSLGFKQQKLISLLTLGNASLIFPQISILNKFDILHFHYPFIGLGEQILFLKKIGLIKIPLIIQYHMDLIGEGNRKLFFEIYNKKTLPLLLCADKILVSSEDYLLHSKIKKYFLKAKNKFEILPLGVDENKFYPSFEATSSEYQNILFVGALDKAHYFKGVDVLIKAFKKVNNILPQSRLIIVGKGDLRNQFIDLAKKLNIRDKIEFADNVLKEELPLYYQKTAVFVLPSTTRSEAFGLVTLEAMASGLPVIVSNLPGPRSLVDNNGFLVKPGDSDDLSAKIIKILQNDKLKKEFGNQSRQLVNKYYCWSKIVPRLSTIYENILSAKL